MVWHCTWIQISDIVELALVTLSLAELCKRCQCMCDSKVPRYRVDAMTNYSTSSVGREFWKVWCFSSPTVYSALYQFCSHILPCRVIGYTTLMLPLWICLSLSLHLMTLQSHYKTDLHGVIVIVLQFMFWYVVIKLRHNMPWEKMLRLRNLTGQTCKQTN